MDLSGLRYLELLDLAREALARATGHDLTELTDAEVLDAALQSSEVASLATAAHVQTAGRLDTSRAWQTSGARSAAAWLTWQCLVPTKQASAAVRCARRLRHMPLAEKAFLAGRLTADHVTLLASCHLANAEAFDVDEELLVGHATTLAFRHFERVVRYWLQLNDPDGAERDADAKHVDRRVDCSKTIDGMVVLDGLLDPTWLARRSSAAPTPCGSWQSGPPRSRRTPRSRECSSTCSPARKPCSACASWPTARSSRRASSSP